MTTGKPGILVQGDRTDRYDTVGVGDRAEDSARHVIGVTPLKNIRRVVLEELPPVDGITKRFDFALRERAMHAQADHYRNFSGLWEPCSECVEGRYCVCGSGVIWHGYGDVLCVCQTKFVLRA